MSDLALICLVFTLLTVFGVPLIAGIGITTALALFLIDIPYTLLAQSGFTALQPFPLLTIPLFILAGRLMEVGGMATRMIDVAKSFVGNHAVARGLRDAAVDEFKRQGLLTCLHVQGAVATLLFEGLEQTAEWCRARDCGRGWPRVGPTRLGGWR